MNWELWNGCKKATISMMCPPIRMISGLLVVETNDVAAEAGTNMAARIRENKKPTVLVRLV